MKRFMSIIVLCLALSWGGCVSASTNTDGDRAVNHQIIGAGTVAISHLNEASAAIGEAHPAFAMIQLAVAAVTDAVVNAKHLEEVHGPPKELKPYTPKNSQDARDKSKKDHDGGGALGILIGGISIGMTLLGLAAKYIPAVGKIIGGPWYKLFEAGVSWVNDQRKKGKVSAEDLAELEEKQGPAQPVAAAVVKKVEAKEGAPPELQTSAN